jgi:hypothetical protein
LFQLHHRDLFTGDIMPCAAIAGECAGLIELRLA